MSSDEQWSDWSEANYIDWEDLQKVYIAERIPESDMNEVTTDHTDHDDCSSTEETSEWSSDDGRWEMNVHQYHQYLRNEPCRRIGNILRSEEWNDTDVLNIQNIEKIAREPIFPRTSYPEVEHAALSMEDKIVEENIIECPHENETAIEYSSEEIISSSDEYVPTKSDISNSDSSSCINVSEESSDGFEVVQSRKRRRFKNKPKCLFESKTCEPIKQLDNSKLSRQKEDISIEMKRAEQQSLSEYRKRHDLNRNHSKRLDVLLKSNALCRQHVPAVGNCFFEAVSRQTSEKMDAITLRQLLCNHIEENAHYYGEFLNSAEDNLCNEIELLRQEDSWQNNLSDTMPLAISNLLAVTVKIYSSNPDQPVVVITPSLTETYEKQEITLAYLCVPGHEHYDSVKKRVIGLQLESENELEVFDDLDCQPSTADITIEYSHENNDASTSGTPSKVQNLLSDAEIITPRKQAKYQSPNKKRLTRKKIANPESWKKNIRKIKCQSGMEYVSNTGKTVKARSMKNHACSKCRFRCADKLSEDERLALFKDYWNLKSYERQRDYISSRVLERNSIGSPSKKRKQVARIFTFIVEGQSVRVCKMFFTATLGISRKTIETALKKKQNNYSPISDKRGKHRAHNRTPTEDLDIIRAHIEAFPVVESHYTRKDTNRKYLDSNLTIRKMYDLYKDECHDKQKRCVKEHVYRNIFCSEFNMSFHKPKKDQCLICHNYNTMIETGNIDEAVKRIYTEHQQRKVRGREEKQIDKEIAKKDKSYQAVTFDLEAVLPTPCSLVSQVYYKRKLSCYNLSFYSLGDNKGTCYLWNETEGERGSCEVASCLHKYITSLPPYVRHISFYSDNCMGQNRNKFVAAALLYSVKVNKHIHIIDQKYLETGHTHMECDSMHAAIEHAKRKTNIYIPSQWDTVIHMARRNNPYVVIPLKYWDILDFKSLQKEHFKNMEQNKKGEKVRWREIKQLQFRKETPNIIYYKYSFREEFNEITCKVVTRGRQKLAENLAVSTKYKERLPITEAKKADLLSLCQSGIIPADCAQFYKSLPTKKGKKDRLPEPDVDEQDQDSD